MKFNYQARNPDGEVQMGTVEASSREIALDILARQNLIVTSLEGTGETPIYARRFKFFQKINQKDIAVFSRQLSIMFSSEVPLVEALKTIVSQASKQEFKSKITEIANDIDAGTPFSKALASHPKIFSSLYVNMIKSGEISGRLSETLDYLARHLEREYLLTSKIKGSMMYPVFIIIAFLAVGTVMMVYVIPKLTIILEESGQELPFITKIIIGLSNFLRKTLWLLLLLAIGATFGARSFLKRKEGKLFWDKLSLRLPVIGGILRKLALARFAENLSTLIGGGLPITQALQVTADVVGNSVFEGIILEAKEAVKKGMPISSVFLYKKEIPPLVTQMVQVGEKSGKISQVLDGLASFYQKEVDALADNLVTLIEPVLIVMLGLGVGILVAAILMPIYNIAGGL